MSSIKFFNHSSTENLFNTGYDINSNKLLTFNSIGIRNTRFLFNNTFTSRVTPVVSKRFDPKTVRGEINYGSIKEGLPLNLDINSPDLTQNEKTNEYKKKLAKAYGIKKEAKDGITKKEK